MITRDMGTRRPGGLELANGAVLKVIVAMMVLTLLATHLIKLLINSSLSIKVMTLNFYI